MKKGIYFKLFKGTGSPFNKHGIWSLGKKVGKYSLSTRAEKYFNSSWCMV